MMKKIIPMMAIALCLFACSKDDGSSGGSINNGGNVNTGNNGGSCGSYNGKPLYKGADGGCYYINSNGNKSYVDRSKCNC